MITVGIGRKAGRKFVYFTDIGYKPNGQALIAFLKRAEQIGRILVFNQDVPGELKLQVRTLGVELLEVRLQEPHKNLNRPKMSELWLANRCPPTAGLLMALAYTTSFEEWIADDLLRIKRGFKPVSEVAMATEEAYDGGFPLWQNGETFPLYEKHVESRLQEAVKKCLE